MNTKRDNIRGVCICARTSLLFPFTMSESRIWRWLFTSYVCDAQEQESDRARMCDVQGCEEYGALIPTDDNCAQFISRDCDPQDSYVAYIRLCDSHKQMMAEHGMILAGARLTNMCGSVSINLKTRASL